MLLFLPLLLGALGSLGTAAAGAGAGALAGGALAGGLGSALAGAGAGALAGGGGALAGGALGGAMTAAPAAAVPLSLNVTGGGGLGGLGGVGGLPGGLGPSGAMGPTIGPNPAPPQALGHVPSMVAPRAAQPIPQQGGGFTAPIESRSPNVPQTIGRPGLGEPPPSMVAARPMPGGGFNVPPGQMSPRDVAGGGVPPAGPPAGPSFGTRLGQFVSNPGEAISGMLPEKPPVTSEGFLGALQEGDVLPTGWKDTPRWAIDKWGQGDGQERRPRQEFDLTPPAPMFAAPQPQVGWEDWMGRLRGQQA